MLSLFRRFRVLVPKRDLHVAALFGVGVWLLIWGSAALRLDVGGQSIVWPAVVAFGMTWRVSRHWQLMRAVALGAGAAVGIMGLFASALLLPFSELGVGIGMGLTAAIVFAAARMVGRYALISTGAALVGFGVGVAIGMGADLGTTTGWSEVGALVTASILAVALGTFAARAIEGWMDGRGPMRKGSTAEVVEIASRVSDNEERPQLRIAYSSAAATRSGRR